MAITLTQATTATETASTVSTTRRFASGTAAGALLVLVYGNRTAGSNITGVSDPVNGAWTRADGLDDGSRESAIYYCPNAGALTSTTDVTITFDATGTVQIAMAEFAGVATASPLEDTATNPNTGVTSHSHGSCVQTSVGVFVTIAVEATGYTETVASGFTELQSGAAGSRIWTQYRITASPETETGTFTTTGSATTACVIATFKEASGGGGGSSIVPIVMGHFRRRKL